MVTGEKVRLEGRSKKEVVSGRSNCSPPVVYWVLGSTIMMVPGGRLFRVEVTGKTRVVEFFGSLWSRSSGEMPVEVYLGANVSSALVGGLTSSTEEYFSAEELFIAVAG